MRPLIPRRRRNEHPVIPKHVIKCTWLPNIIQMERIEGPQNGPGTTKDAAPSFLNSFRPLKVSALSTNWNAMRRAF